MATLLCHIEINPGKESDFEQVMKEMYRRTHAEEPNCVRYEYFRGAQLGKYYSFLSFTDSVAFWQHQISDYHEGFDFASMIKSLDMEWIDPVADASPLISTHSTELPAGAEGAVKTAAETFPVTEQGWWDTWRKN